MRAQRNRDDSRDARRIAGHQYDKYVENATITMDFTLLCMIFLQNNVFFEIDNAVAEGPSRQIFKAARPSGQAATTTAVVSPETTRPSETECHAVPAGRGRLSLSTSWTPPKTLVFLGWM